MKKIKLSGPYIFATALLLLASSCDKLVGVGMPITNIVAEKVFSTDAQATAAMGGVYTQMINGASSAVNGHTSNFASGLTAYTCGMAAGEMLNFYGTNDYQTSTLKLTTAFYSNTIWTTAYKTIYGANAVIEGVASSTSPSLHDSVRVELTAEAKFVRAFGYYYLVNLFGGVPLVKTIDFNITAPYARATEAEVYAFIVQDLEDARAALPEDYYYGLGERIVPNKWAATALLARVHLAMGNNQEAYAAASEVIGHTDLYGLPDDLNQVFLKNSRETIWQLQQTSKTTIAGRGNATPEGYAFLPYEGLRTGHPGIILTPELLNSFEAEDKRRTMWIDSTDRSAIGPANGTWYKFLYKYKVGNFNRVIGAPPLEYSMVLRLAEQYLIRAEAAANGAGGGAQDAIDDLNELRRRAGIEELPSTLNGRQLKLAVAQERNAELFCEWGHRWIDLKRMGLAHDILSNMPKKQPWQGDHQLLFPIPPDEISRDHNLKQNPGYF